MVAISKYPMGSRNSMGGRRTRKGGVYPGYKLTNPPIYNNNCMKGGKSRKRMGGAFIGYNLPGPAFKNNYNFHFKKGGRSNKKRGGFFNGYTLPGPAFKSSYNYHFKKMGGKTKRVGGGNRYAGSLLSTSYLNTGATNKSSGVNDIAFLGGKRRSRK